MSIYDIEVKDIDGKVFTMKKYENRVMLIVNVASKCGFTNQYEGLEELHKKYFDKGLSVLGFPCNQFLSQEPGTEYAYKSNFFNPNIFTEYGKSLESGHNFKVMLGFQSELFKQRDITASQDGIMSEVATLNTTQTNAQNRGGYSEWATAGFFGRVNYDYKGRYLAEVNMRYDGTSRFLRDNRWNLFPSFSLGWNMAREAFFEDLTD
jgi:glutathione peroxidase-family protein